MKTESTEWTAPGTSRLHWLKCLEWLLPPRWRKRKALDEEAYLHLFSRVDVMDPAFLAIGEMARDRILSYANAATNATQPEQQRLIALDRCMTLARFIDDVEQEAAKAREEIRKRSKVEG